MFEKHGTKSLGILTVQLHVERGVVSVLKKRVRLNELHLCRDFLVGDMVSNCPSDTVFESSSTSSLRNLSRLPLGKEGVLEARSL